MIVDYIDAHKADYGVEPICRVLSRAGVQIAPSTYYAAKTRPPSARAVRDVELVEQIHRVHTENYAVYGARKVHAELNRQGIRVARCTVERSMRTARLRGIGRTKNPRTTIAAADTDRPADLVKRGFAASAPDQLWVADIERHEALLNRVEVRDHHGRAVAAAR
ncbi:hypothetical protein D1O33_26055 (plasmid) [Rhodococcus rhodochrous]|uniref:IS3 family transposase n=1 Tax=Rhodococcus rhodochrous TaxID=1829 RepID=UPI00132F4F41|nr:IS3 family transposase [Rhodococcus rhodochrous]QHG85470.1 hypothetical protein D1O33_26055 [Rhodococcus rhodochrous]